MTSRVLSHILFCLIAVFCGLTAYGAPTSFTDRGKTDFDTALPLLNPYGTWSKIDGLWAYTPLDHLAPYTKGRWIYTEYGWYWKGDLPHSWVTEHYGYWKKGADKVWSWYPGPFWLPEIVEIRSTTAYVGWRSAAVDDTGTFVESPEDRYLKIDEWTFVSNDQFAGHITPDIIAKPDLTQRLILDSTDCRHTYLTYREIDRPGPHPADFLKLGDGGMFPPKSLQDQLAAQPIPAITIPGVPEKDLPTNPQASTNSDVPKPTLVGDDPDPSADRRQVKYWITMSLPTPWTKPPDDAKPNEIYLYRPDFYQDEDGIARRITLWFNPQTRTTLKDILAGSSLGGKSGASASAGSGPGTPALPAADNPFRSPLDNAIPQDDTPHQHSSSSKNPVVPSGLKSDKAPIPLPYATNSPPTNPH